MAIRVPPTKAELDIPRVSWHRGPRSVRDLQIILNESKPIGYTTVLTPMRIMPEKGLVERDDTVRPQIDRARQRRTRPGNNCSRSSCNGRKEGP